MIQAQQRSCYAVSLFNVSGGKYADVGVLFACHYVIACFLKFAKAGKVLIDLLYPGHNLTDEFAKVSYSKERLFTRYKELKNDPSRDAVANVMFDFCKEYLSSVNHVDIEEQIKQKNLEQARRDNESDRLRGERQQAMEVARNSRMQSDARELEIMRTEAGLEPVSRVTPEYI